MQHKILDTATTLFLRHGLRAVSVDDISRELRISKKTFYQYYGNKEDLIDAVLIALEEKRFKLIGELIEGKNAVEALISLSREMRKKLDSAPELLLNDLKKYYPAMHKGVVDKHHKSGIAFFKQNVEQGIAEGLYRPDLDADFIAIFYNTQIHSSFEAAHNLDKKKYPKKKLLDFFFDLYFRVVVNEKGRDYYLENYHS
jgi:AcrR family transcriptional regulator